LKKVKHCPQAILRFTFAKLASEKRMNAPGGGWSQQSTTTGSYPQPYGFEPYHDY
jgi:hypothetical protein